MTDDQREIQRKLRVLQHADKIGCVSKTCRYFGIAQSSFYRLRAAYRSRGEEGLKGVFEAEGFLSGLVTDEAAALPSSSAYRSRFCNLLRAYRLVGF